LSKGVKIKQKQKTNNLSVFKKSTNSYMQLYIYIKIIKKKTLIYFLLYNYCCTKSVRKPMKERNSHEN